MRSERFTRFLDRFDQCLTEFFVSEMLAHFVNEPLPKVLAAFFVNRFIADDGELVGAGRPAGGGEVAVTAESSHHSRNDHQDRDKDDEEQKTWCWGVAVSLRHSFPRSLVFAANRFEDRIDPFGQTTFVIVVPKMRFDPVFRDIERS